MHELLDVYARCATCGETLRYMIHPLFLSRILTTLAPIAFSIWGEALRLSVRSLIAALMVIVMGSRVFVESSVVPFLMMCHATL